MARLDIIIDIIVNMVQLIIINDIGLINLDYIDNLVKIIMPQPHVKVIMESKISFFAHSNWRLLNRNKLEVKFKELSKK